MAKGEIDQLTFLPGRRWGIGVSSTRDVTAVFALAASVLLLLPAFEVELGDVAFGLPLVLLAIAGVSCARASRIEGERRAMWRLLTLAIALAGLASAAGLAGGIAGGGEKVAFYLGSFASVVMLAGLAAFAVPTLLRAPAGRLIDTVIVALTGCALAAVFVVVPGFRDGDSVLTLVALIDALALLLALLATVARDDRPERSVLVPLVGACAAATLGDGLVSATAAGQVAIPASGTAVLWAVAAYAFAVAANTDRDGEVPSAASTAPRRPHAAWVFARTLLPLAVVLGLPALGGLLWATGELEPWAAVMFIVVSVVQVALAFGRQAHLLVENRRIVDLERAARAEAQRRNQELEALTALATTMTQTLEETPLAEQALPVLQTAARATSAALHVRSQAGSYELRAAAAAWQPEQTWPGTPADDSPPADTRAGRAVVRLTLAARDRRIGTVTLERPASDPFAERELEMLGLLVDELGVALQNASDYREKLEQSIRDPLTGLYNRRFLFEALDKEIARTERYGSHVSLVIFDVDDFKTINDDHGHAAGDDVLRAVGGIGDGVLRPSDSFARTGGEEFGLLLPETSQLDALLIAERVRTAISRSAILDDRRVTVSGGIASCPRDATVRDDLHRRADAALSWAKSNGKDLCAVASEVTDSCVPAGEQEGMLAHLHALVAGIDGQHLHTRDHSENVAAYAVALGQALGLDGDRIVRLRRAALLHDIGKVAMPRAILEKPSKLDDDEFEHIKLHAQVGAAMLAHAGLREEAHWVRHHHERLDGAGYPDGVAGDDIPLEARIIFVADSFEAMTSDRPYRSGMDVEAAVTELRRCAGGQFEAAIVDTLIQLIADGSLTVLRLRRDEMALRTVPR